MFISIMTRKLARSKYIWLSFSRRQKKSLISISKSAAQFEAVQMAYTEDKFKTLEFSSLLNS